MTDDEHRRAPNFSEAVAGERSGARGARGCGHYGAQLVY